MRNYRPAVALLAPVALVAFGAFGAFGSAVLTSGFGASPQSAPVAPAAPAQPPRDPRVAQPLPAGKGSITGTIVVAGSGQPARRARVSLSAYNEPGGSRSTMTDDAGRFSFTALPEGRFNLSASKPGHIGVTYGQRRPGRSGTPIQLADGQRMQVQLTMWRGSVITGTLVDENGEAIPGTPVRALRYVMQSGQRTLQSAGNAQTDDRGAYRIYGLQPGDYIVSATPRNVVQNADARQAELMAMMRAEEAARTAPGAQAQAVLDRLSQVRAIAPAAEEVSAGYAPVYYPGTTAPGTAGTVTLAPGEEKTGIDFQYQVVPMARIDGIVSSSGNQPVSNVQLTLVNLAFDVPGVSPGGTRADAQGNFWIANVPPGQYRLIGRATIGGPGREGGPEGRGLALPAGRGDPAGRGRAGGPPASPLRLWAATEVTVDGRPVSNVMLTLQPGMTVSGHVAFDGTTQQPPADLTRVRVNLVPATTPGLSGELASGAAGSVEADGRFTIASVLPGRYRLLASAGDAGAGWSVQSSIVEGQDALDFPLEVKPGQSISGATITFTDRRAELSGTIVDDRSQPVPDYTLVVYPSDRRYWTPQTRRIQTVRPATDGRFTFRSLPPGEYRLAPVLDPEPGSWQDPAFLQQLDSTAVSVSLADGEKKEQNLRVASVQ
jgi:protocatechuate 3,4-dioxygenase beta subunit